MCGLPRKKFVRRGVKDQKPSKNILINGENLSALTVLKEGTSNLVDVILIDPPYNAGNGVAHYKNKWSGKSNREWASNHGEFLDFMEPRLRIGKTLLRDSGVVFVNICDGEYPRLKILMDEIFDEHNCIGTFIWNKNQGQQGMHMIVVHEYILAYANVSYKAPRLRKNKPSAKLMNERAKELKTLGFSYKEAQYIFKKWASILSSRKDSLSLAEIELIVGKWEDLYFKKQEVKISSQASKLFKNWLKADTGKILISSSESGYNLLHPETFRLFCKIPSHAHQGQDSMSQRKIKHPITKKFCKIPTRGWKWCEAKLKIMIDDEHYIKGGSFVIAGQFVFGLDETTVPRKLQYLDETMCQSLPSVINISHGGQRHLPPGVKFSTPKPVDLNKELLNSIKRKDIVVLDFFAGSGSTAQAVHELNQEDGGTRTWVMIEEMESTFNDVLVKRCEHFDKSKDFTIYDFR